MFQKIRSSLKLKILYTCTLILLVAGVGLLSLIYLMNFELLMNDETLKLKSATMSEANSVSSRMDFGVKIAEIYGTGDPSIRSFLKGESASLDLEKKQTEQNELGLITDIIILSKEGKVVASTDISTLNESQGNRSYYKRALSNEKAFSYELDFNSMLAKYFSFSPVRDENGNVIGVVRVDLDHEYLFSSLAATTLHDTAHVMVVDGQGMIIHAKTEEDELQTLWTLTQPEKEDILAKYSSGAKGNFYFISQLYEAVKPNIANYAGPTATKLICKKDDGALEILSAAKTGVYPIFVVTEYDTKVLAASTWKIVFYTAGLSVVLMGIALVIISLVLTRYLKPLGVINKSMESMVHGNLDQTIEVRGTDELSEIAFNLMTVSKNLCSSVCSKCGIKRDKDSK